MDNRPASQPKSHKSHKHDVKQAASTHASEVVDSEEKRNMSNSKLKNDIQHGVAHPLNELEQHVNDLDDSWETESMLAEMLDGLTDDKIRDGMFSSPLISLHYISFHLTTLTSLLSLFGAPTQV